MYLATHTKPAMFSDETNSSATVAILLSPCVSINFFFWTSFSFFFRLFYLSSQFLSFEPWIFCVTFHLIFEFLIFVYFPMLWMLVIVNKVKYMALHRWHASQITSSKILFTQSLFRVSNEISPILVSHFLGNNLLRELLAVRPKKQAKRKGVGKKLERQLQSFFALYINSTKIAIITFLKFLKLTVKFLLMSNDITSFWSKENYAKKNSAVEPDFSFWIKIFIKSYLLQELETISIILSDISQNKVDSVTFVYTRNCKIKSNLKYIVRHC